MKILLITLSIIALASCGERKTELDVISSKDVDGVHVLFKQFNAEIPRENVKTFVLNTTDEFGSFTEANDSELRKLLKS